LVLRLLDGLNRDFGRRDERHGPVTGGIGRISPRSLLKRRTILGIKTRITM
jgi:hypothetical protein